MRSKRSHVTIQRNLDINDMTTYHSIYFKSIYLLALMLISSCGGGGSPQGGPALQGAGQITFFTAVDPVDVGAITVFVDDVAVGLITARFLAGGPICGTIGNNTVTVTVSTGDHLVSAMSSGGALGGKSWSKTVHKVTDSTCKTIQINANNLL